jgi:hypothetical protein
MKNQKALHEYKIFGGYSVKEFNEKIEIEINNGWMPMYSPYVDNGLHYVMLYRTTVI